MVKTKTAESLKNIFDTPPLTRARMVDFGDKSTLSLPPDFLEGLRLETAASYAILIVSQSHNVIRIIPTGSKSVIKISIEISELSPHFLEDLTRLFSRLNIKALYSTGLVFTIENCFYEVFFDLNELPIPNDCFEAEVKNIRGVSGVEMKVLAC
ncbi:MAG: hypothetical protein ACFFD4_05535 [Candidatus Odinarchaeota archaeon]